MPQNCKGNLLKGKQASGKVPQLFLEAAEHRLKQHRVSFKGYELTSKCGCYIYELNIRVKTTTS